MEIKTGIYRHYGGKLMRVHNVAKHSETLEDMVFYEDLEPNEVSQFWVRPLAMFQENVTIDGQTVPRFEFLRDS